MVMTFDYIRKLPPLVSAKSTSQKLGILLRKRERWGCSSPNLDREIALCEEMLDHYLLEAGYEALETVKALQDSLDEYEYRKVEGYLTDEQIDQVEAIKSHIQTVIRK